MLDNDSPGLGVDFIIDAGDSYGELTRLASVMESTEAKVLADAKRIEQATKGMVDLTAATVSMKTFGTAATRELASAARELTRVEKAGEGLVLNLERQNAAFGKTRTELRGMKAEAAAVAAEQQGLSELAQRIRAAELSLYEQEFAAQRRAAQVAESAAQEKVAAAERAAIAAAAEEKAVRDAAAAYRTFEAVAKQRMAAFRELEAAQKAADHDAAAAKLQREAIAAKEAADQHARLAAMVRGSNAAQEADQASLERLRAATDPIYTSTKRLNDEIAESTRLYHAGVTPAAEYGRQQEVLTGRMRQLAGAHDTAGASARRGSSSMTQLSFQINDVATMAAMGAPPFQIFASQIGQIVQVAQQAEGGLKGFGREVGGLALRFAPLIAVTAVAGVALYRFKEQVEKDAGLKAYAEGLGLTHKEMKKLGEVSVTTGDMLSGLWKTIQDRMELKGSGKKLVDYLFGPDDAKQVGNFMAEIYGLFVGGYKGIVEVWGLLPSALQDLFIQAVNGAAGAIETMVNKSIGAVNALASGANALLHMDLFGKIDTVQVGRMENAYAGAGKKAAASFGVNFRREKGVALAAMTGFFDDVGENAQSAARKRLAKKAGEIIADRTPKTDKHAEQLARDAAAIGAQIRNLYALAEAYKVSGAAALIAEARVKAESQAIKQRADIEAAVDRQVRLSIAQRVSDAEKGAAAVRDQAGAQEAVNAMVAAGLVPAELAADLVRDRIADLPLLAAIEAAQQRGLTVETAKATQALDDQRTARERLTAAEQQARFDADMKAGGNRIAELQAELRLVGATDAIRAHELATIKATQEAEARYTDPAKREAYIAQQVRIADETQRVADATRDYNEQLTFSADRWDIIAGKVQSAASGMADAFGNAGRAIGDLTSIFADFQASEARADAEHKKALDQAHSQQARDRENALFALRSSGAQIEAYGDMASAAKGFFKEGSTGYKTMAAVEKAYRTVQFAMSVQAMIQNAAETLGFVSNAAARATADGAAGIAAQSKLPFPANIAAMAATAAALVAAGVAIVGGGGGGGRAAPATNTGTGTVLGDGAAQSESVKRSIDALKEVDTLMLTSSRDMAASLRSIDSQIGGLASVLVRSGNISADDQVAAGFKMNAVGSVLSKIPLIGGILGGLFGTKTTVLGSGLYADGQSVGSIIGGGFDAQTYSDVEKKKKLFGITTSTKTSTVYGGAVDANVSDQFALIIRSFNDAIVSAAGPLGAATTDIAARVSGFVVNLGKIDLSGLTGTEIQEKLTTVFGAAADQMAAGAFPGIERFQKVGEGAFETLVRVASTVEQVTASLEQLGASTAGLGIDAKMGLAAQFDSIGDLTSAVGSYFEAFYTPAEQTAARAAQLGTVFSSLGLAMPATLAGFRQLVEAQDLTTSAGQATYATLLQLAPAFAELKSSMDGAKSAADVLSERQDLQRKLLELQGNTAAIRVLDLAKLDASNRGLQQQIYAVQDAQDAAKAAEQLRQAWTSVGASIMDEVKRIRGLTGTSADGGFATLMGQFNAATMSVRGGDQDAAKSLPGLSQALLKAAADAATSRQELDRIQAETAASLEATYGVIGALTTSKAASSTAQLTVAAESQGAAAPAAANDDMATELRALREEVAGMRSENNAGHAATAGNTGRIDKRLDLVTADSGGQAVSVASAA